jgi:hypothetical protein
MLFLFEDRNLENLYGKILCRILLEKVLHYVKE